jgi:hypothetical protein
MTAPAGGPGQKVPAQVRAAAGDPGSGRSGDLIPGDSEDRIHEATQDRSYQASEDRDRAFELLAP